MMAEETVSVPVFDQTRSGGAYIPPARLAQMQQIVTDKKSEAYQRMAWEALKKSINGLINKVNISNIKHIVPELFSENLIRGRGLFARSMMKAQSASLPFTRVYAAVVAVVNTKLPMVGEVLLKRLIIQFRRSYRRNDKAQCLAVTTFLAHLVNQRVGHDIIALQILTLLLEKPTDDSVEIAVGFMRECGLFLQESSPAATNTVYERFRSILHEGQIDKRVQYMIEIMFQVRKEKFKEHPIVIEELDLVEEEEQITHFLSIDEELDGQDSLNIFKFDSSYLENEEKYQRIKAEILGEDSDEEEGSSDEEQEETENAKVEIQDRTSTNLVNLRKTIYLVVMSSVDFEECVHKLIKLNIAEGQEIELCKMLIECNSQERTYNRYYGLIGERLCKLNQIWMEQFDKSFRETFETIHRYETSRIRNTGRFFGHLFSMDALPWSIFEIIHLNEEETTSASRIFIKVLFQDLCESLGLKKLKERLSDPFMQEFFTGIFPKENPRNTRFSINYFTSIGLGGITDDMREFLKQKIQEQESSDESEEDSSEYESSDQSDSECEPSSPRRDHNGKLVEAEYNYRMRSPSPSRSRGRSPSRSRSPARRHHESRSRHRETDRSPVRRHLEHERSRSRHRRTSRSPVKRHRDTSRSPVRRHRETYRSPVRRHHERSRSRHRETSRSPVRRHRERSRSPVRRRHESPSRESSRSPTREKRSRSINRRSRSRTPKRYNKRSRSRSRH